MTFVVSQATVFLFGIRMKKLFVLSACLLVGTCLAQSLTDDIIGVAVSSSFWGRPQYQTFRAAQSTGIYCIVDQSLALSCDFNAESREK